MGTDSAPVLLWGTAPAHLCLGQSQSAAHELVAGLDVPVVRRPLGGGTVWVDENQFVYVLIAPLRYAPQRPADWSAWALQPAIATFHQFGLDVERHREDLWLRGKKIAGTGSATIGQSAVFASSFMMQFPRERFAGCIAGTAEFRDWLKTGLAVTLTDWGEHAPVCAEAELRDAFCAAVVRVLGWRLSRSAVSTAELLAIDAENLDMHDDGSCRSRMHQDGIKLNADSYLVEREVDGQRVRELTVRGAVARRAVITT